MQKNAATCKQQCTAHTKIIKHKTNQPSPPSPYSSYYTIAITRPPIKASISPSTPHRASGRLGLHISRLALHIASRPSSRLACHITRRTTSHTNGHRRQRYNQPAITLHRLPRLPKPCPSTSRCRITTTCVAPGTSLRRIPAYTLRLDRLPIYTSLLRRLPYIALRRLPILAVIKV